MNGGVLRPSEVSEQSFDLVRKGYDPVAVKAFLQRLRGQIEAHTSREEDLERRLAEAERRADNPELDHDTLTKGLGHEMAQVLGAAQEAGRAVLARAEAEAEGLVELARAEASRLTGLAGSVLDDRTREAEGAARVLIEKAESRAGGLLEVARTEAAAIVEAASAKAATRDGAAKAAAAAVVEAARREGGEMIAEARELRTRVLTDLAKRRRLLHLQVERLRAARESLTEVVRSSRVTFGALDEGLARAEGDARLAAEAAVRQVATESEPEVVAELESALVLARHADLVGTTAAARRQRRLDQPAPAAPVAPEPEPAAAAPEPEPEPAAAAAPEPAGPEPAAAAAPEPAAGVADAVEVVRPVDTLFARLRAERSRARSDGGTEQDSNEEAPDTEPAGLPDPIEAESALQVRDAAIERVVSA
ncbi:MAG: DivIVA domain-containing protein, partial [Acidimicrobiales bacterium]